MAAADTLSVNDCRRRRPQQGVLTNTSIHRLDMPSLTEQQTVTVRGFRQNSCLARSDRSRRTGVRGGRSAQDPRRWTGKQSRHSAAARLLSRGGALEQERRQPYRITCSCGERAGTRTYRTLLGGSRPAPRSTLLPAARNQRRRGDRNAPQRGPPAPRFRGQRPDAEPQRGGTGSYKLTILGIWTDAIGCRGDAAGSAAGGCSRSSTRTIRIRPSRIRAMSQ